MTADRPHILFHRPTLWASDIQCSTKLLSRLWASEGWDVTYLQSPLDPVHLLRGKGYLGAWQDSPRIEDGVRIVTPATPVPVRDIPPLDGPAASDLRYRLCLPSIRRSVSAAGRGAPDVVWTTVPGSAPALRAAFPAARLVFHVIDYYPAFRGEAVKRLERRDYAVADDIFVIGQALKDYLTGELGVPPARVSVLGQGVETERYQVAAGAPPEIAGLAHPRGIWTGVLSKGDPELFAAAARAFEAAGGSLLLIGPSAPWAERLAAAHPQTVKLIGSRPPPSIPAYLCAADIGLMLYDRAKADVYRGQNPLKLYEYAAAGLAIVSTRHDEFATLAPPVEIVDTPEEAGAAITAFAAADPQEARARALGFAARHDWRSKVRALIERYTEAGAA
ncbi:glycosyltransferase [Poseidonocella sp. HB161398]|uniref:glycosyltransferase n=1 Tax=Poseidonocella sp. HB161398 TaxID=2320855 RepID=UPI001108A9C9|nr:glycosyltransferase [Poseidonocella sp. HB161398]